MIYDNYFLLIANISCRKYYFNYIYYSNNEDNMKTNLRAKRDENVEYVGVNIYTSDKAKLDDLASASGITLASVLRTAINNLIDSNK